MMITHDNHRRPAVFSGLPRLTAAESTRLGGVSPAPYNALNLGKSTDDLPENVQENRRRFLHALGWTPDELAWSKQIHSNSIRVVTKAGGAEGHDALVTQQPGILLAVSIADCTPILVCDTRHMAVAAIHAGWRGAALGIVQKTLALMQALYGTRGADCRAYVGTCIDECSFEVGEEVAAQFDTPFKRFDPEKNKYLVDLKKASQAQLRAFGIPESGIGISPFSTVLNNREYFSHRLEKGVTGRMMAVIGMR